MEDFGYDLPFSIEVDQRQEIIENFGPIEHSTWVKAVDGPANFIETILSRRASPFA
tara:strand:- start:259 stop:426 length:168 start_codon:yes stop_codon:yes gene_type:complete